MNRSWFLASSAAALAISATPAARADDAWYVAVTRVAPVDDGDGGVLHDLEIEYSFPGVTEVWAGNLGAVDGENTPLGTLPAAGVLRYLTGASYVVFRAAPDVRRGRLGSVLTQIDISREYAKNVQANVMSHDDLPQPARALTIARIKYALGLDSEADAVLSDPLSQTQDQVSYWNGEARLLRGSARENLKRLPGAETDYTFIVQNASRYDDTVLSQAHVALARMLRLRGDLTGALKQYNAVTGDHTVAFVPRQWELTTFGRHQRNIVALADTAAGARKTQASADADFGQLALAAQIRYRQAHKVTFRSGSSFDHDGTNAYHAVWEPMTFANKSPAISLKSNTAKFPARFSMLDVQKYLKPTYFQDFESIRIASDSPTSLASRWTKITVRELKSFEVHATLNVIQVAGGIFFDFSHRYIRIGTTTPAPVNDLMAEVTQPLCSAVSDFEEDIISALKCGE
jgi:hypothetical protein